MQIQSDFACFIRDAKFRTYRQEIEQDIKTKSSSIIFIKVLTGGKQICMTKYCKYLHSNLQPVSQYLNLSMSYTSSMNPVPNRKRISDNFRSQSTKLCTIFLHSYLNIGRRQSLKNLTHPLPPITITYSGILQVFIKLATLM